MEGLDERERTTSSRVRPWVPAFAGMTEEGGITAASQQQLARLLLKHS
jgi:hypothetical protein